MENLFIKWELAKQLKEIGFDKPCLGVWEFVVVGDTIPVFRYNFKTGYDGEKMWFNHNVYKPRYKEDNQDWFWSAPMYDQIFAWFREKHELFGETSMYIPEEGDLDGCITYIGMYSSIVDYKKDTKVIKEYFSSETLANDAVIKEMIKKVKS